MTQNPAIAAAAKAAATAVVATAASSSNDMNTGAVVAAKPELQANIEAAIAATPAVQHITNTEPHFWMKRTFWSQIGSYGAALAAGIVAFADKMSASTADDGTTPISYMAVGLALYAGFMAFRAGRASEPLFTPKQPKFPAQKG